MPARVPRILVADDQHDVLESVRLLLKGENFTAETFDTPDALVRALRARAADAVAVIDADRGGREAARHEIGRIAA
jgi:FixJ family two-component response regulator